MTDLELLEAAAKAAKRAGLNVLRDPNGMFRDCTGAHPEANIFRCRDWRPLTDDGDALRLAVKLGLVVETGRAWVSKYGPMYGEDVLPCPYAATRRAIVRAAAAMASSEQQVNAKSTS